MSKTQETAAQRQKKLKYFRSHLEDLSVHRKRRAESGFEKAALEGGDELYKETVNEILRMMIEIKLRFEDRINEVDFFKKVLDSNWRQAFANNFQKIFIDRASCILPNEAGYKQFNRIEIKNNIECSDDICYAEGFACAFLHMLNVLYERFAAEEDNEIKPITFEEIHELMQEFGKISVSRQDISHDQGIIYCGSEAKYDELYRRKIIQEGYDKPLNVMFSADISSSLVKNAFGKKFNHEACGLEFFQRYSEALEDGANPEHEIVKLVDLLGSATHMFSDANGRSAILVGWFLSFLSNKQFPITYYPYYFDEEITREGIEWTKRYLADPYTRAATEDLDRWVNGIKQRERKDLFDEYMSIFFIQDLMNEVYLPHVADTTTVDFDVPFDDSQTLAITRGSIASEANFLILPTSRISSEDLVKEENVIKVFNPRFVVSAVRKYKSELLECNNLNHRNAIIAMACMGELWADETSEEDYALCDYIIARHYPNEAIQEINCRDEFDRFITDYCEHRQTDVQKILSEAPALIKHLEAIADAKKEAAKESSTEDEEEEISDLSDDSSSESDTSVPDSPSAVKTTKIAKSLFETPERSV